MVYSNWWFDQFWPASTAEIILYKCEQICLFLQRCWLPATTYTRNVITKNNHFYSVFQSNGSLFSKGGLQISSESLVLKSPPHLDVDVLVRRFHRPSSKVWVKRKGSWLSDFLPWFPGILRLQTDSIDVCWVGPPHSLENTILKDMN